MTPEELEQLVHRRLRSLPPPRAPRSLAPAVMARIRTAAPRPWYARPWHAWPGGWQVASAAALVLAAAAAVMLLPMYVPASVTAIVAMGDPIVEAVRALGTLTRAGHTVLRGMAESFGGVVALPFVLMLGLTATAGAALRRVALGGAYR